MHNAGKSNKMPSAHALLTIVLVATTLEASSSQELGNPNQGLELLDGDRYNLLNSLGDTSSIYDDEEVENPSKRAWNSGFTGG